MLKKLLGDRMKKFAGKKDYLEAVCAGVALVTFADGSAADDEIDAAIKAVAANRDLAMAFNPREIEQVMQAMLERAKGGRVGRMGLMREIEEGGKDPDQAEAIVLAMLDVADQGGISPEEKAVLDKIGKSIGVDVDRLTGV